MAGPGRGAGGHAVRSPVQKPHCWATAERTGHWPLSPAPCQHPIRPRLLPAALPQGPRSALREGPLSHCPPRPQCRRHRCVLPADHPPLVKGLGGLRVGVRFSQKLFKYECLGTIRLRFLITSFQSRMDVPTLATNPFLHMISDSDFSTGFLSFLLSSRPPPHPRGHLGPEARGPPR